MVSGRILNAIFFLAYGASLMVLSTFFVSLLGTVSALLLGAPIVAAAAALQTIWALWPPKTTASTERRGRRFAIAFAKSLAWAALLLIPVVVLVFLPAGHVIKTFEEPGQEFVPWPPTPPSTIVVIIALLSWASALLLAAMPMLDWARSLVDGHLQAQPAVRPGPIARRFAIGLAALLVSAELAHQALDDGTTRPLSWLWCAGNSNASKVAKLWDHYDRSKPWSVGWEYLIPMDWDVEILDSTRTVRRYYTLRLVPRNSATASLIADGQTHEPSNRQRSLISSIQVSMRDEGLPYLRYSESGRFVCGFDQDSNLMACRNANTGTPIRAEELRAEIRFRRREFTGELVDNLGQHPLPGESYYLPSGADTDRYFAVTCRGDDCSLFFVDADQGPRPMVTVAFPAANLSEVQSIHAFAGAALENFRKAAADFQSGAERPRCEIEAY